ncbi:MAG: PepSY-associated TM helix domain-containing protein [Acinetobacter sp.]
MFFGLCWHLSFLSRFPLYQRRDFYRHARYIHGWLSAFTFITLMFFATTGLLLNNPDWFADQSQEKIVTVKLPANIVEAIRQQENPSDYVLNYLRKNHDFVGRFQSGEVVDGEVMIHLQSPAGVTDIWVKTDESIAEITQKSASVVSLLNDLHKGKNTAKSWKLLIDIVAILILVLSVAGYILFLTLKTRLVTHLTLTALSLLAIIYLIWSAV